MQINVSFYCSVIFAPTPILTGLQGYLPVLDFVHQPKDWKRDHLMEHPRKPKLVLKSSVYFSPRHVLHPSSTLTASARIRIAGDSSNLMRLLLFWTSLNHVPNWNKTAYSIWLQRVDSQNTEKTTASLNAPWDEHAWRLWLVCHHTGLTAWVHWTFALENAPRSQHHCRRPSTAFVWSCTIQ